VGDYSRRSGGSDTIRASDGGLRAAFEFASDYAGRGNDILVEGLNMSAETEMTGELTRRYPLHVLVLATSPQRCARQLASRQRSGTRTLDQAVQRAAAEFTRIMEAADTLQRDAEVESHSFESALSRACELLALSEIGTAEERTGRDGRAGISFGATLRTA
jgi:hypothetical protein